MTDGASTVDLDKARPYFQQIEQQYASYHDHKENMANAGFLVQIGLFGAVVSQKEWVSPDAPSLNLLGVEVPAALPVVVVYFLLWILTHAYIRWQLDKRTTAAVYAAAIRTELLSWLSEPPTAADLVPYRENDGNADQKKEDPEDEAQKSEDQESKTQEQETADREDKTSIGQMLMGLLYYLFPIGMPRLTSDVGVDGLPHCMASEIKRRMSNRDTGAVVMEKLMLSVSLLLAIIAGLHFHSTIKSDSDYGALQPDPCPIAESENCTDESA